MDIILRVAGSAPADQTAAFAARVEEAGFAGVGVPDSQLIMRDAYVALALAASARPSFPLSGRDQPHDPPCLGAGLPGADGGGAGAGPAAPDNGDRLQPRSGRSVEKRPRWTGCVRPSSLSAAFYRAGRYLWADSRRDCPTPPGAVSPYSSGPRARGRSSWPERWPTERCWRSGFTRR